MSISAFTAPFVERLRPLTRAEYDRMVEVGLFEQEKVELIRGMILRMSPQHSQHAAAVQNLNQLLVLALAGPGLATVRIQSPMALSDDSEPEPDVAVVPVGSYREGHPTQAHLLIEVAESSLQIDRGLKAELYAAAEVPEYWVVDVVHELVEVHTDPVDGSYSRVTPYRRGESIPLAAFPHVSVDIDAVFR